MFHIQIEICNGLMGLKIRVLRNLIKEVSIEIVQNNTKHYFF